MRLLHLDPSGRLVLTDFHSQIIPPYAILSHRWGDPDSEVLFEDLGSNAYKEKDGYRKIEFCAKQAAQDQLQYFWVDTCCIDKWNLRELSSSINSMFRWYKNAARCYVLLSYVCIPSTHQQSHWENSFKYSEWFRRGWTLQELVAPISVEFYSCEGQRIGDKTSLEQLVHDITSIPLAVLQNCPLDQFTVSERMQWANNRETTEKEDIVYCLLGILNVSMPVSYGEGKEKALGRLLAEVGVANSAPFIVPFSRNDRFVGRESQLAELETKLSGDKQTTRFAIVGPGGTGKSQLALELAYRTRQNNQNCSVFWIDASNLDRLNQSYAWIAQKLNIPSWDDEKTDTKQLVKLHLEGRGARQCLLIFDNTEETNLGSLGFFGPEATDLIGYLPQSELCSIVFTTTDSNIAKRLASQNIVELQHLTPITAQRMFEKYLDTPLSASEQQEAKLLLQELFYLPLAIVQAAACINNTGLNAPQYRSQLGGQMKPAFKHSDEVTEDKLRGYGTKNPVATTLFVSMDKIRIENALAADYLYLAACVDSKDIPLDFLQASSPGDREDAMKMLSRYDLITRRPTESAFDLHRLVHHALRERLQTQGQRGRWTEHAITQLIRVFPDNDYSNRSKWRRLLPHAKHALSQSSSDPEGTERLDLIWKCAMALHSDGQYSESEELFVQVRQTRRRVLGDKDPDTLTSMEKLALSFYKQGKLWPAEELFMEVIDGRKITLGAEHVDTLSSMRKLASVFWHLGRWEKTQELNAYVLESRRRILGEEHLDTLISLADLASIYKNQGRWGAAEELEAQIMETRERVLDNEHPDTLISMANLASTYGNQGRWKEAKELEVHVMEIRKRVLGNEHPDTLTSMVNLASTYSFQGRWNEAEELQVKLVETHERTLGLQHPGPVTNMANLAFTWKAQGRIVEAITFMRHCVQQRQLFSHANNPDLQSSLGALEQWEAELADASVECAA